MKNTANLIQVIPFVRVNLVYFGKKYSKSTATKHIALNFTSVHFTNTYFKIAEVNNI